MKNILISIPLFFIALFVYTKLVGPIPFSVNQVTTTKTDLFTVSGTGKATATPDIGHVSVGIQANGSTVKGTQDDMNKVINNITAAIKKLGIDSKDIKTTKYTVNPMYDYSNGKQQITGYSASTNCDVTIRQLDKANAVIDAATAQGANTVGGVIFDLEDKTKAENEARQEAIAQAKKKAVDAARVAGFNLGKIINYQESFSADNQPRPLMMAAKASGDMGTPTELETGTNEVQVTVTLSYEIR